MRTLNKRASWATTKPGFALKVWVDRENNAVLPTNCRLQAAVLGGEQKVRPHRETRRNRLIQVPV